MPTNEAMNLRACKERDVIRDMIKAQCDRMRQEEDAGDYEGMLRTAEAIVAAAIRLQAHAKTHGL